MLHVVVTTLAAHRLGKEESWKQLFTDGTSHHQSAKQNLSITIELGAGNSIPALLDTDVILEDKESDAVMDAMFRAVKMKGVFLT